MRNAVSTCLRARRRAAPGEAAVPVGDLATDSAREELE